MTEFARAILNPEVFYKTPEEVLEDGSLSDRQKLAILRQWEYDEREMEVAEEENMGGGAGTETESQLRHILEAIHTLSSDGDSLHTYPTKQGSVHED